MPQPLANLQQPYPQPEVFYKAAGCVAYHRSLVRLWLSEGIPYAFQMRPAVYETLREWLAEQLSVHPKEITLIGSGRIGFSLSPYHPWRSFSSTSDLDFSVISKPLLERLASEFESWARDYDGGDLSSVRGRSTRNWRGNLNFGRKNIPRGFMDADKIPRLDRYPLAQLCGESMYRVQLAVSSSNLGLHPKKASIRVYRDWDVFISRVQKIFPELPAPSGTEL